MIKKLRFQMTGNTHSLGSKYQRILSARNGAVQ
jgi:hypothetical protein